MKTHTPKSVLATMLLSAFAPVAHAEVYGGITFPGGVSSFADEVIRYIPTYNRGAGGGAGPTDSKFQDPNAALGAPDFVSATEIGSVSLGGGGLLELLFTDNLLTNSGDSFYDLHVFEIGVDVEASWIAIRPLPETALLLGDPTPWDANGDGFYEVGTISGGIASIDIDSVFTGFGPGVLKFDAVQIIDAPGGIESGRTPGGEIDAVGAISSLPVPEPSGILLFGVANILAIVRRKRGA